MDSVRVRSDKVVLRGTWFVPASRSSVYAVASDFAHIPKNFPKLAHSIKIINADVNRLSMEAQAASFGRLFPRVRISMEAELLPNHGYRCSTFNRTFKTQGQEELLLHDAAEGTQLEYTYVITLKYKWLLPLFGWLLRTLGLAYWKKHYLTRLTHLAQEHQRSLPPDETDPSLT